MSTNKRKTFFSALALCCYWCIIICLALLLMRDGGLGNGSGTGDGYGPGTGSENSQSLQSGTGNASEGDGDGASENDGDAIAEGAPAGEDSANSTPQGQEAEPASANYPPLPEQHQNAIALPVETEKDTPFTSNRKVVMTGAEASKRKGFFGSGGVSGRVLFILDVSGSMASSTKEGISRMDLMKRELKKVLNEKLKELETATLGGAPSGRFLIMTFSDNLTYFPQNQRMLSFKERKDLQSAIAFADTLSTEGGTNMMLAWKDAIKLISQFKIDCVYFLSDGEPTDCNEKDLLKAIRTLLVRINTFSLGTSSTLMENVAKRHRGRYFEIY